MYGIYTDNFSAAFEYILDIYCLKYPLKFILLYIYHRSKRCNTRNKQFSIIFYHWVAYIFYQIIYEDYDSGALPLMVSGIKF